MSTENPTEFNVNGLVIFDLNDLPEVTVNEDTITAGNTTIPRPGHTLANEKSLSYEELREKAQELYAIALTVRDMGSSPELERMMAVIRENSDHTYEESRDIALAMIQGGVSVDA